MSANFATLSGRGTGLISGGLISFGLAFYTLHLLLFAAGFLIVAFVAAEYLNFAWSTRGFSKEWFRLERFEASKRVNRKALGLMGLRLIHEGHTAFYAEVWDSYPQTFRMVTGSPRILTWWNPGEDLRVVYGFRPYRRGAYTLGPTFILAHDAFGLAFRTLVLDSRHEVTVLPSNASMPSGHLAMRLRTKYLGTTVLRQRGYGTEFRSLREYHASDDFRSIAWKHSTKGRLFVKEFEQEMRQDFLILLDTGSFMGAGRLGEDAMDLAVDAATMLTSYIMNGEDRIGLLAFPTDPLVYLPPKRGPRNVARVLEEMALINAGAGHFSLPGALDLLSRRLEDRTHVFAFAAAQPPTRALLTSYSRFAARGHRLYLFTPELFAMYPPLPTENDQRTLAMAQSVEGTFARQTQHLIRSIGIPVISYDRRGATVKVLNLYSTLKAWGSAS